MQQMMSRPIEMELMEREMVSNKKKVTALIGEGGEILEEEDEEGE